MLLEIVSKYPCHARAGGHPQARLQMDFRIHGNDSMAVCRDLLAMLCTLNQNRHSEVLRGIPRNLAKYNDDHFPRIHKILSVRPCVSALKSSSEVPHA